MLEKGCKSSKAANQGGINSLSKYMTKMYTSLRFLSQAKPKKPQEKQQKEWAMIVIRGRSGRV